MTVAVDGYELARLTLSEKLSMNCSSLLAKLGGKYKQQIRIDALAIDILHQTQSSQLSNSKFLICVIGSDLCANMAVPPPCLLR